ncbi:TIGR03905 family TSCPD domain-containing protein [Scatolibacter rhodanostii]|uniref:TIGR03905 family TSCPD domain-containing protein n=1 Tax=Scatolibacter rhodanostii TaxID=2014781 RepID=UPI000C07B6DF|nr:TIGR03905 family TSCPD domain-containing protein [Scatolibacter rhodanostii]
MKTVYKPSGVCARTIEIEVEDGIIKAVKFNGGCNGNSQGISALAIGMKASDYIERCKDITCGPRNTSCPAQLAKALEKVLEEEQTEQ